MQAPAAAARRRCRGAGNVTLAPSAQPAKRANTSPRPILDTRLSTQIAETETRLKRWIVGTVLATAMLTVGIFRLFGRFP